MSRFFLICAFLAAFTPLFTQNIQDEVVPVQLSAGLNPAAAFISWANPQPSDIVLRRRLKGEPGNAWTELTSANETLLNGYFDYAVDPSQTYEYVVERTTAGVTAYGYAFANFFAPVVDSRGKLLVFIDSTTADQLGADLVTFKNDIRGEGWQTVPIKTGPFTTVQWVKNRIVNLYNSDPNGVKAVLLIGNVPIPYSGSQDWDTKADHTGAWPCDAYYGDVDGVWTDNTVNLPNTARNANRNVPGDGKFDQNVLPSAVELPVGRLDFRRLSQATFGLSPVELLRRYMLKNHLWRTGQYKVQNKALVDDNLGWSGGEAFGVDGYRNAIPLVGEGNVVQDNFISQQRYLMAYGSGVNGTYSSALGIGNSNDFATDSIRSVFTNLYGDYFGDWDFDTNPLMPALLASKGSALAVSWAGRPHWLQHALATGESMGYCLKETQNAQFNTEAPPCNGESGAHVALLGDPTLRARIVPPPGNLTVVSNCNRVNLHWTASPDPEVVAYLVYRSFSLDGPYTRQTPDLVFQTSWEDHSPVADTLFYSVRAVKLEVLPGGGAFYNSSTGIPKSVVFVPGSAPSTIALGGTLNCNISSLTLGAHFDPPTCTVQWYKPDGSQLSGYTTTEGGIYTVVVTAPNGCTTAAYATVYVDTLLPELQFPTQIHYDCNTPTTYFTVPDAPANVHYYFNGVEVQPGQQLALTTSGEFKVASTANGCSKTYSLTVTSDNTPPGASITYSGLQLDCNHPSVQLFGHSNAVDATYLWSGPSGWSASVQNPLVAEAGEYCVTATGTNGCTSSACVSVTQNALAFNAEIQLQSDPCTNGDKLLQGSASMGNEPYSWLWSTGATTPTITVSGNFAGQVGLTVTDAGGCMSAAVINLSLPLEVLAITKKESAPGASDGQIDLLILHGQAPFSFQWSNGSTTEDLFGISGGSYAVTVTGANGCTYTLQIPLSVSVEDVETIGKVEITPNPASDELRVWVENADENEVQVECRDLNGRLMAEQIMTGKRSTFDTSPFPAGTYILRVKLKNAQKAFRVAIFH